MSKVKNATKIRGFKYAIKITRQAYKINIQKKSNNINQSSRIDRVSISNTISEPYLILIFAFYLIHNHLIENLGFQKFR